MSFSDKYNKCKVISLTIRFTKILIYKVFHSYCTSYNYDVTFFINNTYCLLYDKDVF